MLRVLLTRPLDCRRSQSPPSDDASADQMAPKFMAKIRIEAPLLREILAEFLGTFILVVSFNFQLKSHGK
jgi:hypothetical protein